MITRDQIESTMKLGLGGSIKRGSLDWISQRSRNWSRVFRRCGNPACRDDALYAGAHGRQHALYLVEMLYVFAHLKMDRITATSAFRV
jgi:hypothetical protein